MGHLHHSTGAVVEQSTIASKLGVSRSRVQQLERSAFSKMRALVFGTDEFPLLREMFAKADISTLIEKDKRFEEVTRQNRR